MTGLSVVYSRSNRSRDGPGRHTAEKQKQRNRTGATRAARSPLLDLLTTHVGDDRRTRTVPGAVSMDRTRLNTRKTTA